MEEIKFLEKLVSIPSPSGEEDAAGDFLVEAMTARGFEAHRDEVGNAVGTIGSPRPARHVVLLGHMDTVPGDIPVAYERHLLYGRGTVDAKGPLATFVMATARVAEALERTRVTVIGAVQEEANGEGARHLARTMAAPEFAVIGEPSDWEGITLGYKGRLCLNYRLTQPGSHSAGAAIGPAEKAVTFWNDLMEYAEARNHGESGRFKTLDPALRDFRTYSDGLNDGVEMRITMRLPPDFDPDLLKGKIHTWANGAELAYSPLDRAFQCGKNNALVRAMLKGVRAASGRPRFKLKTGTSDMNTVGPVWQCPIVAYGPGDSSLDHTPEEHIDLHEFKRAIDVLAHALKSLDQQP